MDVTALCTGRKVQRLSGRMAVAPDEPDDLALKDMLTPDFPDRFTQLIEP